MLNYPNDDEALKVFITKCGLWLKNLSFAKYDTRGPVFIVGTGRSGTHFMAEILASHEEMTDLTGGRENQFVFGNVTSAALSGKKLGMVPILKYRMLAGKAYPKIFVDQSHPNLWHIEELLKAFPTAKFICMVRDPYSVAYSTLQHDGVKARLLAWEKYIASQIGF